MLLSIRRVGLHLVTCPTFPHVRLLATISYCICAMFDISSHTLYFYILTHNEHVDCKSFGLG